MASHIKTGAVVVALVVIAGIPSASATFNFSGYPPCAENILLQNAPTGCDHGTDNIDQLTETYACLCTNINCLEDFASRIYRTCGCPDLISTAQLFLKNCNAVSVPSALSEIEFIAAGDGNQTRCEAATDSVSSNQYSTTSTTATNPLASATSTASTTSTTSTPSMTSTTAPAVTSTNTSTVPQQQSGSGLSTKVQIIIGAVVAFCCVLLTFTLNMCHGAYKRRGKARQAGRPIRATSELLYERAGKFSFLSWKTKRYKHKVSGGNGIRLHRMPSAGARRSLHHPRPHAGAVDHYGVESV